MLAQQDWTLQMRLFANMKEDKFAGLAE